MAESRGDVLAIIDATGPANNLASYVTKQEKSDNAQGVTSRVASVSDVVTRMQARNLNTSYGATYYPWVQISDSVTGKIVPIPPSIVALGAMSYNDSVQAPWFAPAGFNRGGLSTGNAGVNVVNIVKKLTSAERDQLYPVNVNPIASFPNEGIVIFGQKTLQATPSALDRINVRRLMLYIKRGIGLISTSILFEPNVQDTWNNFKDQAEPFLADVKARFGLTDYRLILDETTTTPDLIDQNILYAKIFLKPARAIEFIAVDFFITKSGASFNI
jgi:phage tail sheath protein FI